MIYLKKICKNLRYNILKLAILNNGGHLGAALSLVEVMTVIYFKISKINKKNFKKIDRDRIIFSKGHGCLVLYSILNETGLISKKILETFCKKKSILGGHPEHYIPGVEASTGSLGHGLPISVGLALSAKVKKQRFKTIVIVGDGELNEGSNWEAMMMASKHKLNNLILVIDYNKIQSYGFTKDILDLEPLKDKLKSFGFYTQEVDGHNLQQIEKKFKNCQKNKNKPSAIICHTIKGKGIEEAENNPKWHYVKNLDQFKNNIKFR